MNSPSELPVLVSDSGIGGLAAALALVRNSLWKGHSQERFHDVMECLCSWRVQACLDSPPAPT